VAGGAARRKHTGSEAWLGWLNGIALGTCIYYAISYSLFLPFACMAVMFFGAGLLPLGPYFALMATPLIRKKYCRFTGRNRLPGYLPGVSVALMGLMVLQLPESITYYGLARAKSEDQATRNHGLHVLRQYGNRTIMLRACYGGMQNNDFTLQPFNLLAAGDHGSAINSEIAREIYYRVTGEAFNAVPPPKFFTRAGRWNDLEDEFVWDDGLGGEQVAGRVKGLSLLSSRLDATTEPEAGISYCEWTMEFKNVSAQQREARAQVALPPGAVVSRVTLWINGEEREAAFGGRAQTRQAYQAVAVQQRRDPLLVTTCGPDRILIQCFPIPPGGGVMKIRLGITAPLLLDSPVSGSFVWPHFLERNFGIAGDFKHALWLEQPGADKQMAGVHENLAETNLSTSLHVTQVHREAVDKVWTPAETTGQVIQQTISPNPPASPERMIMVLDGSVGMRQQLPEIARTLDQIPENVEMAVIIASDKQPPLKTELRKATAANKAALQHQLRTLKFSGGQDNLPALETAWDLAETVENSAVVWLHLPEPFLLSSESGLIQRLERNRRQIRLHEIQLRSGPDRIVEKMDGFSMVEHDLSLAPDQSSLARLLAVWSGRTKTYGYTRQLTNAPGEASTQPASKHVARLWARDEALRLVRAHQSEAAATLAAQNQLVTPLTGAVVLETKAQYDQHNLKPTDPKTVPTIPEPRHLMLVALVIVLLYLKYRRPAANA